MLSYSRFFKVPAWSRTKLSRNKPIGTCFLYSLFSLWACTPTDASFGSLSRDLSEDQRPARMCDQAALRLPAVICAHMVAVVAPNLHALVSDEDAGFAVAAHAPDVTGFLHQVTTHAPDDFRLRHGRLGLVVRGGHGIRHGRWSKWNGTDEYITAVHAQSNKFPV